MSTACDSPEIWIVTGGIATGKSTAVRILQALLPAADFFDADSVVATLLDEREVLGLLDAAFGPAIICDKTSRINRAALRDLILSDPGAKRVLEEILHPRVRAEFVARLASCRAAGGGLLVADVPLYYETGAAYQADRVVVVAISAASQRQRLHARSAWPQAAIDGILGAQWPIFAKLAAADTVWWNEGPVEVLERQIGRFCAAWSAAKPLS